MAGALGLHAVAPGPILVLTFGQDLFPVVSDSISIPRFVNSQVVASCHLGFLIMLC